MTRRKKLSTSQALRPTPLIAVGVVMILMASTLMAGAQPEVPETTEVGSDGNEKYAVEWKDGSEINVGCGAFQTTCAGVGAVVIDIEEIFVVVDMFGYSIAEVTVGLSSAVAASAGYAKALPTGSVWMRGWGEMNGNDDKFSEYHRNGYIEGSEIDEGCFEPVLWQDAVCIDGASRLGSGGNCVRALAQVKASNAFDHAYSQQSTTEMYAAAHTEDKCVNPNALVDVMESVDALISGNNDSEQGAEMTPQSDGERCTQVSFEEFPLEVQRDIVGMGLAPVGEKLNISELRHATLDGDKEDYIRLMVMEKLIAGFEEKISLQSFPVCSTD